MAACYGYRALDELAGNLFNAGHTPCSPVALMGLDEENFAIALAALLVRRGQLRASDVVSAAASAGHGNQEEEEHR